MKNRVTCPGATGGSPVALPQRDSRAGRPYGAVAGCFLLCSLIGLAGCGKSAGKEGGEEEPSPVPVRVARAEERTLRPSFVVIGTVVADAHTVYDHLFGPGKATEAGCWSHLRQYVLDALVIDPPRVRDALACIQALFLIERGINRAPPAERARTRQE